MTARKIGPFIVAGIITAFLIVLAYLIFFVPQAKAAEDLRTKTATAQETNVKLQKKVDVLLEKKQNLGSLTGQVQNFSAAFPSETSERDLFNAVLSAAAASGVTVTTLTPSEPLVAADDPAATAVAAAPAPATAAAAAKSGTAAAAPPVSAAEAAATKRSLSALAVIGVSLNAEGSPEGLRSFVTAIEGLKRPLVTKTISITSPDKGPSKLILTGKTFLTKPLVAPKQ